MTAPERVRERHLGDLISDIDKAADIIDDLYDQVIALFKQNQLDNLLWSGRRRRAS